MATRMSFYALIAFLAASTGVISAGAHAASLEITPVAVHVASGQRATIVRVMNRGPAAAAIQLRAFAWSQDGDRDLLAPTQDIILSPPIFTVPHGATQTIRLLLRNAPGGGERTYRLMIDEVPTAAAGGNQIMIAMRVSVPLVVAPAARQTHLLRWRARRGADGRILLTAANAGNVFDRLYAVTAMLADGSHPAVSHSAANAYILRGAERHWLVQTGAGQAAGELRLSVTSRAGTSEQIVAIEP